MPTPAPDPARPPLVEAQASRSPLARGPLRHFRVSDLRGLAQMATRAGLDTVHAAETLQAAWKPFLEDARATPSATPSPVPPRTDPRLDRTMRPYSGLRGFVRLSGQGVDALLAGVDSVLEATGSHPPETRQRAAALAALNALAGEHLAATRNPLATRMLLLHRGQVLRNHQMPPQPDVRGRVLLMVHGCGTTEGVWQAPLRTAQPGMAPSSVHGMGEALAAGLDGTVLHLRYNSGLPVSENGRQLGTALEALLTRWPATVTHLAIVAHGRGGLVVRSAVAFARQQPAWRWPKWLRHLVFVGTDHHDLPPQEATPLPEGVACCTIAGALLGTPSGQAGRWMGDGVVSIAAALGRHPEPGRNLVFARELQHVVAHAHHFQLPRSAEVAQTIIGWLQPG